MEALFGDSSDDNQAEMKPTGNKGVADIWSMDFDEDDEPITKKDKQAQVNKKKSMQMQKTCSEEKKNQFKDIQADKTLQRE